MTRWEYRTLKFEPAGWLGGKSDSSELQDYLNRLGDQCWEVTGIMETNTSPSYAKEVVILLKRPKP